MVYNVNHKGMVILCILIALIPGSCIKPVGIGEFLNDPKVQELIKGEKNDIDYEHPQDHAPVLELADGTPVEDDDTITVTAGEEIDIRVTGDIDFDTVEWYYGDYLLGSGVDFTADTAVSPFDEEGIYSVTVVGTVNGVSYSILFYIAVAI